MIECTERYLLRKLGSIRRNVQPVDRIARLLLHQPTPFSLDWLANQANLSSRQFERKFKERMGIGPKLFSRIGRFYQAFTDKNLHPEHDWLTVAIQYGYSDYYHLAKDFRQFSNVTPNLILQQYAQRPELIVDLL
ncbi:helix-turn-helix domain-containing protein [Spirosoma aerolatum]|uniref:helix-turn-helix domain-containing protein n=1 Tax=Spirosoma aerolatum TaxID=1211326 RepID=UPI0009AE4219|nr:AraC family transcriptional regulator [Spirosoma aerolatum]